MFAAISNVTANGIKFNGQNYDDWIEYVKLHAGLLGLDSALVMDEPTKPTYIRHSLSPNNQQPQGC